jgi:hypothetical protein
MTAQQPTEDKKRIKELEKYLRQSKQAIPGILAFGAIVLLILMVAEVFCDVPWWVYVLCLWVVPFGLIGDGINIVYINRRLKSLKSGVEPAAAADG